MARVLVTGGTGFIGRQISSVLADAGHAVTAVGRTTIDLARETEETLRSGLAGFEVVVNCAGLVRDRPGATMAAVHAEGAERLFRACLTSGVRRLIHISALGVGSTAETAYQRTKAAAEEALVRLDPAGTHFDGCVLRPSVVIGRGGASTALFAALAALPLVPRIGTGTWQVQPVHVSDVAELVLRLVERKEPLPRSLDVVGPEPMSTDDLLTTLRAWLGLGLRPFLPIPEIILASVAVVGTALNIGPVNRETLIMLRGGNTGNPEPFAAVLGRGPLPIRRALALNPASQADRWHARLFFVRPLLRWSLGLLWVVTGLLSFGIYPVGESYRMLADVGLQDQAATFLLYGAAAIDLVLGLLLLARWRPVAVGAAMLIMMSAFTLIATGLPAEYWLHPFAPLLKNLPIAAATLAMMAMEA
jgi:uncharacterized protein YbjT (DUF2867 family)